MAEKRNVEMENGTVEMFGVKQKMLKTTTVDEKTGAINTVLKFSNGAIRMFTMPSELVPRFASHGADQKFGDVIAGIPEVDDCVLAVDDLMERLMKLEWSMKKSGDGFSGLSVLAKALVLSTGKSADDIKVWLKGKTQAEKNALRGNAKLKVFILQIEEEKAKKANKGNAIDTDTLLGELDTPVVEEKKKK